LIQYTVSPGDYLSLIAQNYQTTVQSLVAENHLSDPNLILDGEVLSIYPGQVVATPAAPAPAREAPVAPVVHAEPPVAPRPHRVAPAPAPVSSGGTGSCFGLDMSNRDIAEIINHESHCNPGARNGKYCGIGQDPNECGLSGPAQAAAMQAYVMSRYGSWAAAAAHERAYSWY
jgi:murein DD-endopeptidase MepM/ murein hydrolase activator NlpD